jgi:hypothetical protein
LSLILVKLVTDQNLSQCFEVVTKHVASIDDERPPTGKLMQNIRIKSKRGGRKVINQYSKFNDLQVSYS